MKRIKSRIFTVLICIVTALAFLSVPTAAEVPIDTESKCRLEVSFVTDESSASSVRFTVYKAASVTAFCKFEAEPEFKEQEITKLLENPNSESYNIIASTLTGIIAADGNINPKGTAISDSSGRAVFENLDTGLYLITGDVFSSEQAYYTPQSFLVSLPARNGDGFWSYDVFAEIKWEKRLRNDTLNLEALKIWDDSAVNLHSNDNVTVRLYKDSILYDTVTLNRSNNWSYRWNNLDGGALWTVNEEETAGYIATVERKEDRFVITNHLKEPQKKPAVVPQTGLLKWPVPILISAGILFILIGFCIKRKGERQ